LTTAEAREEIDSPPVTWQYARGCGASMSSRLNPDHP
jgi:hypothetical protein